ncbi:zf-HC2 domain-containing protein [Planosporangium sp. 12N6]|uniref:zf-HC2 domain-containing protein n=1 Tax=Planosporangium spinosum TaxID=3402278 RepID=UPI003CF6811A
MTAHFALTCDQARLALSARLDGEPIGVPADRLGSHLDTCPACADWLRRAEQVTRLVRLQPARVPDLTRTILAAVAADRARPVPAPPAGRGLVASGRRGYRRLGAPGRQALMRLLQAAVAAVAAMQLLDIMPVMLGISADAHASHEVGAFAAAVAAAFLLAAFQPRLARAYTPIAVVLAVCLIATSGLDIGEHRVTVLHELVGHLGTLLQTVLIFALGRLYPGARQQAADRPGPGDPARAAA